MIKRLLLAAAGVAVAGLIVASVGLASTSTPSGQVMYGGASFDSSTGHFVGDGGAIEPAFNYTTGSLTYIQTPNNATFVLSSKNHTVNGLVMPVNVAPLYLPVYPENGFDPGSVPLNCPHQPEELCPDHGNIIASVAEGASTLYAANGGVAGHDHLIGVARSGGDFNVIWEPVVIAFNTMPTHRITKLSDLLSELKSGAVSEIPLPPADFHCSVVSAAAYNRGTPAPGVAPNPL